MISGVSRNGTHVSPDGHPTEPPTTNAEAIRTMAELADAEAVEAEAVVAAARARARAIRLRQQETQRPAATPCDGSALTEPTGADHETTTEEDDHDLTADAAMTAPKLRWSRRWRARLTRSHMWISLGAIVIAASLAGSGYIALQHREVTHQRQQAAEFAAAARHGVVGLTSLDFATAREQVQQLIDSSTGAFRDDFQGRAEDFTQVVEASKVVTKGTVQSAAVQSMTADSAVVLVAATSEVTNSAGEKQQPRAWRLSVTVTREGDQIKMSRVEFVA